MMSYISVQLHIIKKGLLRICMVAQADVMQKWELLSRVGDSVFTCRVNEADYIILNDCPKESEVY